MKPVLFGLAIAVSLTGFTISHAPPSHADKSTAFGEAHHQVICNYVGQEPTPHGIWAANSILMSESNLNYGQMQAAIGYAIKNYCPQYDSIYSAYRSRYP
jgi:hypothetical protein